MCSTLVDYENLITTSFSDANNSIKCGVRPRWERKRMQAKMNFANGNSSSSTGDRFIPNRSLMDMERNSHSLLRSNSCDSDSETGSVNEEYRTALNSEILGTDNTSKHRVLSFKDKAPTPKGDTVNNLKVLYSSSSTGRVKSKQTKSTSRYIPSAPSRILDAPDILDDYYLNLLSWSDTNVLAVALSQTVYLWNAASGSIQELYTFDDSAQSHISSLSWVQEGGTHLAIGTSDGNTRLWDTAASKQLRCMDGHSDRVSSLSWNKHMLSSGGRDSNIVNHDVRVANHKVATLSGHSQEVCGLSWSPDGLTLASGGNDNQLCLWDATTSSTSQPRYSMTDHQAAVKALAWSPHERNLLATGAGTADRTIKFWNTQTGALLNSIDTGSQVCSLAWNPNEREILSSHGFARNQLCLWNYPTMTKIKELEGHTARVLHTAVSPDGGTVVSAGADETLRFWNVFDKSEKAKGSKSKGPVELNSVSRFGKTMHIR